MANDHQKLELERMHKAILDVTLAWSSLESSLAFFLNSLISKPRCDLGFAIYYSVASAEARFGIIDKSVTEVFNLHPHKDAVMSIWSKYFYHLKRVKTGRNEVTHGEVVIAQRRNPNKLHIRLTQPMFHTESRKLRESQQPPGKCVKDVESLAKDIGLAASFIPLHLVKILFFLDHPDENRLLEALREAQDHLLKTFPNRTSPEL